MNLGRSQNLLVMVRSIFLRAQAQQDGSCSASFALSMQAEEYEFWAGHRVWPNHGTLGTSVGPGIARCFMFLVSPLYKQIRTNEFWECHRNCWPIHGALGFSEGSGIARQFMFLVSLLAHAD